MAGGFDPIALLGSVLDGRYRLLAHIASGGMGAVFRAEQVYMRKELALKVLRPELCASAEIAERFRREAEIAASLEHQNIVRVTDFGKSPEGWLFLAMELLHGEGLFDRLRRERVLDVSDAIEILIQVCSGLEAAHGRGFVHRDLKPENVFLCEVPAGRPLVKILDFGIAKITDPTARSDTQSGMVVGTPEYLSPEQASGGEVDGRADLYALGLIAWRMLAGRHPFKAPDARALIMMQATQPVPLLTELRPDLAGRPDLVQAVARACAKEVEKRYRTAAEFRCDLAACLGEPEFSPTLSAAVAAPGPGPPANDRAPGPLALEPPVPSPARAHPAPRRRWPILALPLALLALGAGALLLFHRPGGKLAAEARGLLARGKARDARALLEPATVDRPQDPEIRVLLGRAFHELGQAYAGIEAYEAAFALAPQALGPETLGDLAGDLGREKRVAERAARLLARVGAPGRLAVAAAVAHTSGFARYRALELELQIGGKESDQVPGYISLLDESDCDLKRAAARRLGEVGDPRALPKLRETARSERSVRGFLGLPSSVPACGAQEASASIRRIEVSRRVSRRP